ncbi:MAG: indolepyruvate oxidoreductase subunit beta [Clostridiales bacterium]|nr:indolepyruvate oxidoreductase subunit beta [Clostridiales bacterium]
MNKNIVLCGVGGQGTVLASKLIAAAAMKKGLGVMSAETIGMAQRGGSVFGNVRIGSDLFSPMIGKGQADIIIGFECGETVRMLPYLKKGGYVVSSVRSIMPTTAALGDTGYSAQPMTEYLKNNVAEGRLSLVDTLEAEKELKSSKVMNLVLLGAAVRTGVTGLSEDDIISALPDAVKPEFIELNTKAFFFTK